MNSLNIRAARPEDADKVAPLIYSAAPEKFEYWLGVGCKASKRKARTLQVLADAFAADAGVQGYGVFWVAELDGEIIGMSAGYRGSDAPKLKQKLVQWALPYFKLRFPQVAKRGLNLAKLQNPIADDFYYGSGLGTDTQCRGQGIGQKMIELQMQRAKSFAISPDDKPAINTFGFDVAVTNEKALSIYHRTGFDTVWKKQFVKPSVGIPDSYRMAMPVDNIQIHEDIVSK